MKTAYPLIAAKVARENWCVTPDILAAIIHSLDGAIAAPFAPRAMPAIDDASDSEDFAPATMGETMIIPVFGIIGKHLSSLETMCGGLDLNAIGAALTSAERNPDVAKVLMVFHSPGGTVTGIPELASRIANFPKPVFGFTDSLCASAAVWLASACSAFYCAPSANVGSVGVYNLLLDETRALEEQGVKVNAIVDGKFKLAGASFKTLTDDERALFQSRVDAIGADFRAFLTARRDIAADKLQGQVFSGLEAVSIGMADGLCEDLDECLEVIQ